MNICLSENCSMIIDKTRTFCSDCESNSASSVYCELCQKRVILTAVHYPNEIIKMECTATHFECNKCGAGYSKAEHFESHHSIHDLDGGFNSVQFEKSTNPQSIIDMEQSHREECDRYAKKKIMYGSACWSDFVCCCDGLLEYFEQGFTVENALHTLALDGGAVDYLGYDMSAEEIKQHQAHCHKNGWGCHADDCEVCGN